MRRIGRRPGFIAGMLISALGALLAAARARRASFLLLCARRVPRRLRRRLRAAVPLRRRRHGEPGLPAARHLAGDGRRRRRGGPRPADRHLHGRSACRRFPSPAPSSARPCSRSLAALVLLFLDIPHVRRSAAAAERPADRRDRAPAGLPGRRRLRHLGLRADELRHDRRAARHGRCTTTTATPRCSASSGMCSPCSGRASSPAR